MAMPFSDGVWFDPADKLFKLWYWAGPGPEQPPLHSTCLATSRDGVHWDWGGTWTFGAGTSPRIGLVAHGGATPPVVASFDYLRFYAVR